MRIGDISLQVCTRADITESSSNNGGHQLAAVVYKASDKYREEKENEDLQPYNAQTRSSFFIPFGPVPMYPPAVKKKFIFTPTTHPLWNCSSHLLLASFSMESNGQFKRKASLLLFKMILICPYWSCSFRERESD